MGASRFPISFFLERLPGDSEGRKGMQCPKCGGDATKVKWYDGTQGDTRTAYGASQSYKHGHPVLLAAQMTWLGIKMTCSTGYRCSNCRHSWREW